MNDRTPAGKSIGERIEEVVRDLLETLESMVSPQPALVPVPARSRRQPPYPQRHR